MTRYTCTVPAIAPSFNEWRRWSERKKASERDAFQMALLAVLNEKGNRCPRGLDRIRIRAVVTVGPSWERFATGHRTGAERDRDGDNWGAILAKWTQDCLTSLGVIPKDTLEHCQFQLPPGIVVGQVQQTFMSIDWDEGPAFGELREYEREYAVDLAVAEGWPCLA